MNPEREMVVDKEELKYFCINVLQLIAGIGWFNVDEEKERVYKFIEEWLPELLE